MSEALTPPQWRPRRQAHEDRVDRRLTAHLARRRAGTAHPVVDFLFDYYRYRPAQLRGWHPGPGVALVDAEDLGRFYRRDGALTVLDVGAVLDRRRDSVLWIRRLLTATASRPAHLGCFGMHEWAMVYRQTPTERRHAAWPLRLSPEATAAVVDERGVRCTHFDAFRFFTASARPLNVLQPTRERQQELEQPGCLHATMDLYKWAYKLAPLVPAELVADCFELAWTARTLDMRASPYDLSALGYPPIPIETAQGRADYAAAQRAAADEATPLRARLVAAIDTALAAA